MRMFIVQVSVKQSVIFNFNFVSGLNLDLKIWRGHQIEFSHPPLFNSLLILLNAKLK